MAKINIEAETEASIARTMVLPAAARHMAMLLGAQLSDLAGEPAELIGLLADALSELEQRNLAESQPDEELLEHARFMHDRVLPAMEAVRVAADALERVVADDLWPLPKYSEILFIK